MNSEVGKCCGNPICSGNGNCATCSKRVSEKFNDDTYEAVTEYTVSQKEDTGNCDAQNGACNEGKGKYAIAIDLGTTTLAFALIDKASAQVLHTVTALNAQRKYGADVLSRIQASVSGKREELRECIQSELCTGIDRLLKECTFTANHENEKRIDRIVIAGNTTMIHLLMGYDCGTLGVYPFTPVNSNLISGTSKEIFGYTLRNTEITTIILPGISAFIGGDIVAGLYAVDIVEQEEVNLFIDLGTNGEMALGNCDRILTTSVAAGPAFEGGNISCGIGSVAGAICSVDIACNPEKGFYDGNVRTIQDKIPCGICGTGVIETVAELLKNEMIDETGLYIDEFFETGFLLSAPNGVNRISDMGNKEEIVFTQKDIREFQMAKAAVRAGIDILISQYGIEKEEIKNVYLAGGFGFHLNIEKAISVGLLPGEVCDKVKVVGNSSLGGMVKFLSDKDKMTKVQKILDITQEIILAENEEFNAKYLCSMAFDA